MTGPDDLTAAIDGVYAALAHRPLRDWTDPCLHCCNTEAEEAALHAAPLRELPAEAMAKYAWHAMGTWGDERELTHFLPRLLELTAAGPEAWPDLDSLLWALTRARWRRWSSAEQSAVERFFLAYWRVILATYPGPAEPDVPGVIEALAGAELDLAPYLRAWDDDRGTPASRHLVDLVLFARLDRLPPAVRAWLATSELAERLSELATAPGVDDELAGGAQLAVQALSGSG